MFTAILSRSAEREFARLPKKEKRKIVRKLKVLQKEPHLGKKLSGQLKGFWSYRAWPYRIIYELYQGKKLVIIHKIAHRQKAYK